MAAKKPVPGEVFISYAHQDEKFVSNLVEALEAHGLRTFYSKKSLKAAVRWHKEIGLALDRCKYFAFVLSPHSVISKWAIQEYVYAAGKPRFNGKIIPILHKTCKLRHELWSLSDVQTVDFRKGFRKGCTELLRIWDVDYKP